MTSNKFWAHSAKRREENPETRTGWQPLAEHLQTVSRLAGEMARAARPDDWEFSELASLAGWLHDFGKYSDGFQQMLATGRGHPQHAIHGALLAKFGTTEAPLKPGLQTVAAAIAGHHAGLADWNTHLASRLSDRKFRGEAAALVSLACADAPEFIKTLENLSASRDPSATPEDTRLDLYIRMLFSCLIDADRLDSAGREFFKEPLRADERLALLDEHLASLQANASEGTVKQKRNQILQDCLRAAAFPQDLFSLSVPTGGGKTLAAMAFALRRAALFPDRFRRVIVVIPYLSIIEQNAEVYAGIFGKDAVLEHHSGSIQNLVDRQDHFVPLEEGEEEEIFQDTGTRPETENWNAPLIVTTSVRFFESLFSNRPSDLRRVHNIARSIVILDEVQTLPRRLLGPLLGVIRELVDEWGANFVFSTATQPAFERASIRGDLRWPHGTLAEIVSDPAELHRVLRRAHIDWEIDERVSWSVVAQRMLSSEQCLAIVNLRDHAVQLYEEVLRAAEAQGLTDDAVVHLSTRMCAAHRLRTIQQIREKLNSGQHCHVVSTQLVEAGVDLDFPLVLRALAPLDSIVQASGRADREGKRTAALGKPGGRVIVFRPEDGKLPPNEYTEATGKTEAIVKQARENGEEIQVDSVEAMRAYFEVYYGESGADLGEALVEHRQFRNGRFATLAREFEMISNRTQDVFVPDDDEARAALDRLRSFREFVPESGSALRQPRRTLQRHTVGLNPSEFERARNVLEKVTLFDGEEVWIAVEKAYDDTLGLIFDIKHQDFCV